MKRMVDIIVSSVALVLLLPIMPVIAALVAIFLGRPVLFRQIRPGLHGRPIAIRKFRSMTEARDSSGRLRADGERLTRFGRILRSFSLDELPELWSVLRGDMSLVGPRPLLMQYLPLYTPEQARRHNVKPGITGWAQVNGRNSINWNEKFALDLWYIENKSFTVDLLICCKTLAGLLNRKGISAVGSATISHFTG